MPKWKDCQKEMIKNLFSLFTLDNFLAGFVVFCLFCFLNVVLFLLYAAFSYHAVIGSLGLTILFLIPIAGYFLKRKLW